MHSMDVGHWEKITLETTVSFHDSRGLPWLPRTLCPEIEFHGTDDGVIPRLSGSSAPNSNFMVHGTDDGATPRPPGSSEIEFHGRCRISPAPQRDIFVKFLAKRNADGTDDRRANEMS